MKNAGPKKYVCTKVVINMDFPGVSDGTEYACNVGDQGLIPGSGRSTGEENGYTLQHSWGFPGGSAVKKLPANAGEMGSTSGLGRSSGEGNDNPIQCCCWEIPWTEEPCKL